MSYFRNARQLLGAFLLVCTAASSAIAERTLTLTDAIKLGLENDETYLIAEEDLYRARGRVREAWGGALPNLNLNAYYTRNVEIPELTIAGQTVKFGSENEYLLGLTLTQPIWLGGKVFSGVKVARYYRNYADYKLKQTRNDVIYEIKQGFFNAKLADDVVEIYEDALEQAELNLNNVQKMHEQGMAAEFDLLRAEVEVANIRPQLIKAKNDSQLALINLKNRLGVDPEEDILLVYEFDDAELDKELSLSQALSHALKDHPSIHLQENLVKSYNEAVTIVKADGRPQLSFQTSYQFQQQSDRFSPAEGNWTDAWSASINLTFAVFDGRANSGRVMQARADRNESRLLLRQIRENVLLSVRSAYASWEEAVASLETQEKTIAQAEEGLRIANLRYESGVGTQLEVLSAQTANTQAKVNYINAIYDFELAVAGFIRAAGYQPDITGDENE